MQLVELQGRMEALSRSGIGVAAISYDSVDILAGFAEERGISFPLLSNEDSSVIESYGILNTLAERALRPDADDPDLKAATDTYVAVGGAFPEAVGTPYPGTFMLDGDGVVIARFFEDSYRERNTTANVMLQLGIGLDALTAIEGSTAELVFVAYASNTSVFAGSRLAIAVDVEPGTDMHVYAPGAEKMGYRAIRLNLHKNAGFRFEPVEYPPSRIYHFEPLDEHVPVYEEPFRLLQEVVVSATSEAQAALRKADALMLTGSLDYQACDDERCYLPASIPLSFRFEISDED